MEEWDCLGPLRCVVDRCVDQSSVGGPCDDDYDCTLPGDLACSSGRCVERLPMGASCTPDDVCGRSDCIEGVCRGVAAGDTCRGPTDCDVAAPYCVDYPSPSAICSTDPSRAACSSAIGPEGADIGCPTGFRCSAGVCIGVARPGEACGPDRPCEGGPCEDGVCRRYALPGETCGERVCPVDFDCIDAACQLRVPDESRCGGPCEEGVCLEDGTCGWLAEGAPCAAGCRLGCAAGLCRRTQTVAGGPCSDDTFGFACADGMECVRRSAAYQCLPHCE